MGIGDGNHHGNNGFDSTPAFSFDGVPAFSAIILVHGDQVGSVVYGYAHIPVDYHAFCSETSGTGTLAWPRTHYWSICEPYYGWYYLRRTPIEQSYHTVTHDNDDMGHSLLLGRGRRSANLTRIIVNTGQIHHLVG